MGIQPEGFLLFKIRLDKFGS